MEDKLNRRLSIKECHCCDEQYYFLPTEVAVHNQPDDCWVSYFDEVYDLTKLCEKWHGKKEIKPILAYAGKDISHWFDHVTGDIRHHVHPVTGAIVPYCPHGLIPDVDVPAPASICRPLERCPWWLDIRYRIGRLTKNSRPCKILNVLTGIQAIIMVCEEDTIERIQERFLYFNAHSASYLWKYKGKALNMYQTLTENGIIDERERYLNCGLPDNVYVPCLMCYYKDDLTVA